MDFKQNINFGKYNPFNFIKTSKTVDSLSHNVATNKLSEGVNAVSNKLKGKSILMPTFKIVIVAVIAAVIIPFVPKTRIVRAPLAGTKVGNIIFCSNKDLCSDSICIGETWRECKPCPTGKSRAAYKVSCDKTFYSECTLKGNICED